MKNFEMNDVERKSADEFIKEQKEKDDSMPTAGERWTYMITPTGLGDIWKIQDELLEDKKDITDWSCW